MLFEVSLEHTTVRHGIDREKSKETLVCLLLYHHRQKKFNQVFRNDNDRKLIEVTTHIKRNNLEQCPHSTRNHRKREKEYHED